MQQNMIIKSLVIGIILLFISVSFTGLMLGRSISKSQIFTYGGNTLYVGGSEPGKYTSI